MSASVHDGAWNLTLADRPLVEAKRWANRLRFAVMLLFFRARGRFPRAAAEVDGAAVAELARTLGVPEPSIAEPLLPDAADRTAERQRAEIRALLGFREAGVADAEALGAWLRGNAVARTRDPVELAADAEARCRALRIEPPTPDRIARIVRTAVQAYEDGRTAAVHARLTSAMRVSLDALLQPTGPEGTGDAENGAVPDGRVDGSEGPSLRKRTVKNENTGEILPVSGEKGRCHSDDGLNCLFAACNHGVQSVLHSIPRFDVAYCTQQTGGLTQGVTLREIHTTPANASGRLCWMPQFLASLVSGLLTRPIILRAIR